MKVVLLIFGLSLARGAPSTLPVTIIPNQYEPDAVQVSRYIGPSNYPGYHVYNYLQIDQGRGVPVAIFADGRPGLTSVQPSYSYFGTPVYDYRYHFNQILPGYPSYQPGSLVPGGQPSFVPAQGPNYQPIVPTTQRPFDEDDGIEKLDEKLDPSPEGTNGEGSHREDNEDDDSVTIDAI